MPQPLKLLIPRPCCVPLIRVGGTEDGAYLVPDDLQDIEACFSPGVNNSKHFEDELASRFGICSHLCDFTSDLERFTTPLIEGKQTFLKKWLEPESSENSISLEQWVNERAGDPTRDLLLQMDIEGAEYRNLLNATQELLYRFRIIVIELHGLLALVQQPADNNVARLLEKLDATHVCVHAHPNNCCGEFIEPTSGMNIPNVIELTLLRRDRFESDSAAFVLPQLPHPEDIAFNVRSNPPLHLNERWLSPAGRSDASTIKMLRDNLAFLQHSMTVLQDRDRSRQALVNRLNKSSQISSRNLYTEIGIECSSLLQKRGPFDGTDVSVGCPFFLSSAPSGSSRTGVVCDSDTCFFETAKGVNQSITIELSDRVPLGLLVIRNRQDGYQQLASNLFWVVHEDMKIDFSNIYPVVTSDEFLSDPDALSCTPLLRKLGRYITVFSVDVTRLHFASLRVFAAD